MTEPCSGYFHPYLGFQRALSEVQTLNLFMTTRLSHVRRDGSTG